MSFVAISRVRYPPLLKQQLHAIALDMMPIAKAQPGFISISFHQSHEINETMMYWEWQEKSHHEACLQSKEWNEIMEKSGVLLHSEGVELFIETYERIA